MEPPHSQILGGAEECHSSESGWTMYLGSPIHDDDDDDGHGDDDDNEEEEEDNRDYDPEDESDDSMASDASSGPSHHMGYPRGNREGNQVEEDLAAVRTKEKEIAEKKVEKKEMAFMDNKGKVPDEKARKNHCTGQRK